MMADGPWMIRALNGVGRVWRSAGMPRRQLVPDALIAEAQEAEGLSDLGPPAAYREGLERICAAIDAIPDFPTVGLGMARRQLVGALKQRLAYYDWRTAEPRRFQTPLVAPLIVVGLPRTGTTLLHRLLSAAPGARPLPLWEVARTFPRRGQPDRRRSAGKVGAALIRATVPTLAQKHSIESEQPEECMHVQVASFFSWAWFSDYPIPSYTRWMQRADAGPAYDYWADFLRFVQHDDPNARLTLKSPSHTGHLADLLARFPDARIVWTHRNPTEVVPSFASLIASTRTLTTSPSTSDPHALGREMSDYLSWSVERGLTQRRDIPTGQLIDVPYTRLVADPLGVVAEIHRHFGLPWTPQVSGAVREEVQRASARHGGGHRYTLADFGLSERSIRNDFSAYLDSGYPSATSFGTPTPSRG